MAACATSPSARRHSTAIWRSIWMRRLSSSPRVRGTTCTSSFRASEAGHAMVIGERFAWAHLPKTGGTATVELFQLFPELIVHGDFEDTNEKHTRFDERPKEVEG